MNNFFFYYIDLVMLAISVAFAWICTMQFSRKAVLPIRKVSLFFLLLGPATVASYMCGHLGEVSYRAIERMIAGNFVYDYKFYSLLLMGIVFLSIGLHMIRQVKAWITGEVGAKKNFTKAAFVLIFLSAPTFPFTPIGLLPTLSCGISLAALPFVVRVRSKPDRQLQQI